MSDAEMLETRSAAPLASSVSNLRPPWQPGESGNPSGQTGGPSANPAWWIPKVGGKGAAALKAIIDDESQPQAKRTAALWALDNTHKDLQHRGRSRDSLCDRIEGKPVQKVITVELGAGTLSDAGILASIAARLNRPITGAAAALEAQEPSIEEPPIPIAPALPAAPPANDAWDALCKRQRGQGAQHKRNERRRLRAEAIKAAIRGDAATRQR